MDSHVGRHDIHNSAAFAAAVAAAAAAAAGADYLTCSYVTGSEQFTSCQQSLALTL